MATSDVVWRNEDTEIKLIRIQSGAPGRGSFHVVDGETGECIESVSHTTEQIERAAENIMVERAKGISQGIELARRRIEEDSLRNKP